MSRIKEQIKTSLIDGKSIDGQSVKSQSQRSMNVLSNQNSQKKQKS